MELTPLQALLSDAADVSAACVGDLMIDRFVYGDVRRMSPEAPVPVLARSSELTMLGAAGNVARNVAALGARVSLVGLAGADDHGRDLKRLVGDEAGLNDLVVTDASRATTEKVRFVAGGQQLLRVDTETVGPAAGEAEARLVEAIGRIPAGTSVILVSDYGKGVVTDGVVAACHAAARRLGARIVVDSKAHSLARYGAVDVVKPNAAELAALTGLPASTDAEVEAALAHALTICEAQAILVTRSGRGMSALARGGSVRHFHGRAREVFDVSGAGDTALAALGVALGAGLALEEAAPFALLAAGVAVGKVGTAVVHPQELVAEVLSAHMAPAEAKVSGAAQVAETVARWRAQGLRVGFTNGCFDILHRGHVAYLTQSRAWCDRLVVGLNSDASVRRLKGPSRPVNDLESRALVLAGLSVVDLVVPFEQDTPLALIEALRPDVLIKGADYTEDEVVGASEVRSWGGEVRLAEIVQGYSTTAAIAGMKERA
jgi:D-beta-D-heptose 7-phosphate kinase/D-beta-D-heptose 1-phosphate adenosyltransferase